MIFCCWILYVITQFFERTLALKDFNECHPTVGGKYPVEETWEVGVKTFQMYDKGCFTESPIFSIWSDSVEEKWYLRLHPAGNINSSSGNFALGLVSQNHFIVTLDAELIVVNQEESLSIRNHIEAVYTKFEEAATFPDFASSSLVTDPSEGFVVDNKIRISVKFLTENPRLQRPGTVATFYWPVPVMMMKLKPKVVYESPKFNTWDEFGNEFSWHLRLHPNGEKVLPYKSNSNSTYTSLFLVFFGNPPVRTSIEFFVKNVRPEDSIVTRTVTSYGKVGKSAGLEITSTRQLTDPENGFVVDDEIVFGIRVPMINMRQNEVSKGVVTQLWEVGVQAFQMINTDDIGMAIHSPKIYVWNGGRKEEWFLMLLGDGFLPENEGFVSLYLNYDAHHATTAYAEVYVVNKDPRKNMRKWALYLFQYHNQRSGWHRFISKEMLLNLENGFIVNDKIQFGVRFWTDPALPPTELPLTIKTWEIELDIFLSGTKNLVSPKYEVRTPGGTEVWYLQARTQGDDDADYFSLDLVYGGHNKSRSPRFEILLMNKKEENTIRRWTFGDYNHFGQKYGWNRFAKTREIADVSKGFVIDNKIKIVMKIPEALDGIYKETCPICNHSPICSPPDIPVNEPCPTLEPATSQTLTTPSPSNPKKSPSDAVVDSFLKHDEKVRLASVKLKNVMVKKGNVTFTADEIVTDRFLHELFKFSSQKTETSPVEFVLSP